MEFGFGMGIGASFAHPIAAAAASVLPMNYTTNSPAYLYGLPSADNLRVDDLLDFSNHDVFSSSASASASATTAADAHILRHPQNAFLGESGFSYNPHSHSHSQARSFADELYIPSEEAAELEWLSKFVEDSFTDAPYPSNYFPSTVQIKTVENPTSTVAPGHGTRSKRSRNLQVPNKPCSSLSTSSSSSSDFRQQTYSIAHNNNNRNRDGGDGVRRCTHCASEQTPQWRTGPLGPKTLCNACGVRYKSGRLVPEYRPAASPTFVLMHHSNSHRKVMEIRRQKEQLCGIIRHENHSSC